MNLKKRLIPLMILLFLVVATTVTLYLTKKPQNTRSKAASLTDTAILLMTADTNPIMVNPTNTDEFKINLSLSANTYPVVGADILVNFDKSKFDFIGITLPTTRNPVLNTYVPVDSNGNFDTSKVISSANDKGYVEFGLVDFNWSNNTIPTPTSDLSISPVAILTFKVKSTAAAGQSTIEFIDARNSTTYNGATFSETTDSNVVTNPENGDPEDILKQPDSTITVNVGGTASPQPTPTPEPSPTIEPTNQPSIQPSPTAGQFTSCDADINQDTNVNGIDYSMMAGNWFSTSPNPARSDINKDGKVNGIDYSIMASFWFAKCSNP